MRRRDRTTLSTISYVSAKYTPGLCTDSLVSTMILTAWKSNHTMILTMLYLISCAVPSIRSKSKYKANAIDIPWLAEDLDHNQRQ